MDRAQTSKKHHYWKKVKVLQELLQRDFLVKYGHTLTNIIGICVIDSILVLAYYIFQSFLLQSDEFWNQRLEITF